MYPYAPPIRPPRMAQTLVSTSPGVISTPGAPESGPSLQGLLWTSLAAAASYAAIRTGIREKGFTRVVGWSGGVAAGLAGLVGLVGLISPSTTRTLPVRWWY